MYSLNLNGFTDWSWCLFSSEVIGGSHTVTNVAMEKNHDTAKDGESKKENTKGSSEEHNSNKGVAEIKVKDGMTEMESMFLAVA